MAGPWRTVRVFISSTFRDMHAERDYLVKVVFPALRERLEQHHIHLVDIDLRWGITEEQATNDQVLECCLDQIDECRPFFLGLLGERYGWVPAKVPGSEHKHGWTQHHTGQSVTELEVLWGVLLRKEIHSRGLFFFRDPSFANHVPASKRADIQAESATSAAKLNALKNSIRRAGLSNPVMEDYPCTYAGLRINWRQARFDLSESDQSALETVAADGLVDNAEYVKLEARLRAIVDRYGVVYVAGLEEFGRQALDRLWSVFQEELKLEEGTRELAAADPLAQELGFHERFIESRLRVYVGREALELRLMDFAAGVAEAPALITAPSGAGKSAALAKFARAYANCQPESLVIPHFIGASPSSTSLRQTLFRFCSVLKAAFHLTEDVPPDTNSLRRTFRQFLGKIPADRNVVFVIDALNQFDVSDGAHTIDWLPRKLPAHVKFIVSCIDDSGRDEPVLKAFEHREHLRIVVPPLRDDERCEIVRAVPSLSAKSLSPRQVQLLLENPATANPLFLLVALEELRGFGSFEQLTRRIEMFPQGEEAVTELFIQVLERLQDEFDPDTVCEVVSLLACAREGLSDRELLDIVEDSAVPTDGSQSDLFPILRQLRPYLQHRGELRDFFHRGLDKAVAVKFLKAESRLQACHQRLALYFGRKSDPFGDASWRGSAARPFTLLPYHLFHAGASLAMFRTLSDARFLAAKLHLVGPYLLAADFELAVSRSFAEDPQLAEAIHCIGEWLKTTAHLLNVDPLQFAPQLFAHLLGLPNPVIGELLQAAASWQQQPWLRPRRRISTAMGSGLGATIELDALRTVRPISVVRFTHNCERALASWWGHAGASIGFFDVTTGTLLCETRLPGDVPSLPALSKGTSNSDFRIVDIQLTCQGQRAICASYCGLLSILDVDTGERLQSMYDGELSEGSFFALRLIDDGKHAVTTSRYELKVWDLAEQRVIRRWPLHKHFVPALELLPDGNHVVSGSSDQTFRIWNLQTGEQSKPLARVEDRIEFVRLLDGGQRLVTVEQGLLPEKATIRMWQLDPFSELRSWQWPHGVCSLEVHEGGRICIGDRAGRITLLAIDGGEPCEFRAHVRFVSAMDLSPDGRRLLSGSEDGAIKLWHLDRIAAGPDPAQHRDRVNVVCMALDTTCAISGGDDGEVKVWDVRSGTMLRSLDGHTKGLRAMALTPDAGYAITSAGRPAVSTSFEDDEVVIWNVRTGLPLAELPEKDQRVVAIQFDPELSSVAFVFTSRLAEIWDLHSGDLLRHVIFPTQHKMRKAAVSGDARIIFDSRDEGAWLSDIDDALRSIRLPFSFEPAHLAASHDGTCLAAARFGGDTVNIWDGVSGHCTSLDIFAGHSIKHVAMTPDGARAAVALAEKQVGVCDLRRGKLLARFFTESGVTACAISADGRYVIAGEESGRVHCLVLENPTDVPTEAETAAMRPVDSPTGPDGPLDAICRVWRQPAVYFRLLLQRAKALLETCDLPAAFAYCLRGQAVAQRWRFAEAGKALKQRIDELRPRTEVFAQCEELAAFRATSGPHQGPFDLTVKGAIICGDYEAASRAISEWRTKMEHGTDDLPTCLGHALEAVCRRASNDPTGAMQAIHEALRIVRVLESPVLHAIVLLQQTLYLFNTRCFSEGRPLALELRELVGKTALTSALRLRCKGIQERYEPLLAKS